jgi:hypothetical protein
MNLSALHWLVRECIVRGVVPERLELVPIGIGSQPFGSISAAERAALRAWRRRLQRADAKSDERFPGAESFEWI